KSTACNNKPLFGSRLQRGDTEKGGGGGGGGEREIKINIDPLAELNWEMVHIIRISLNYYMQGLNAGKYDWAGAATSLHCKQDHGLPLQIFR
ncbi:hypothetical protein ACJX0J_029243, partial [Zea mays]